MVGIELTLFTISKRLQAILSLVETYIMVDQNISSVVCIHMPESELRVIRSPPRADGEGSLDHL